MHTELPELKNTAEKHAEAVARLAELTATHEHTKVASSAAQRALASAQQRVTTERERLTSAQRELTNALAANLPLEKLQQKVSGHRSNIESLETLLAEAQQAAIEADKEIGKSSGPIGSAQADVYSTRFMYLTVELAKIVTPAIPLCRELESLSHILGVGLSESGYVLDLSRPNIGRYTIDDDGSIRFFLR